MTSETFPQQQTHAQLAAILMRQAAKFFRSIGEQNPPLNDQMQHNAQTFEEVAVLVEQNPTGVIEVKDGGENGAGGAA
jgi:hypothetical protein